MVLQTQGSRPSGENIAKIALSEAVGSLVLEGNKPAPQEPSSCFAPPKKALYLESIRGIAALVVVLHHFVTCFNPFYFLNHGGFFVSMLTNGHLAVRVFFVLSGVVLSLSFFRTGSTRVVTSAALRRYFRLVVPVFVSVMLSWVILQAGLYHHAEAISVMASDNLHTALRDFIPDAKMGFPAAAWSGLAGVFFDNNFALNPVLWTMPVELTGSFLVFAILALFGTVPKRGIIYLLLAFLLHGLLLNFLCGIAFCDLYVTREKASNNFHMPLWVGGMMMCCGLVMCQSTSLIDAWLGHGITVKGELWFTLCSAVIVGGAMASPATQHLLEARALLFLGKISYPLYIVHWLINLSLGSALYVGLRHMAWGHGVSATIVCFVCFLASLVAARALCYITDTQGIRLGKWVEKQCLSGANRDRGD